MSRPHGTRTKYVREGCKCAPCRRANATYEQFRTLQRARGQSAYVGAEPVRQHVRGLMAAGVGKRRIAVTIGLSESALCALLYGRPGRPPSRRIRATTARKLLALNPNSMAPGRVSAEGTRRRIEKLMSRGWSRSQLAAELGMSRSSIAQLPKQRQVYASTAAKVLALYARLPDAERAA